MYIYVYIDNEITCIDLFINYVYIIKFNSFNLFLNKYCRNVFLLIRDDL